MDETDAPHYLKRATDAARVLAAKLREAGALHQAAAGRLEACADQIAGLELEVARYRAEAANFRPQDEALRVAYDAAERPHLGWVTHDGLTRLPPEIVAEIGAMDVVWLRYPPRPGAFLMIAAKDFFDTEDEPGSDASEGGLP